MRPGAFCPGPLALCQRCSQRRHQQQRQRAWLGDRVAGEALHRQALALWEQLGNAHAVNRCHYHLALCAYNARRYEEALARLAAVCASARAQQDWKRLSVGLDGQANTLSELRDWAGAADANRESVRVAWGAAEVHPLAYGLWNTPRALAHLRQPEAAARLMAFIAGYWITHFGPLGRGDHLDIRRVRRLVEVQVGKPRCAACWAEGERLTLGDAVASVLDAG